MHAQRFVVVAAKIFLERYVAQQLDALAESLLLIRPPKKAGIVEAGAQHTFVAVADQSIRVGSRVKHRHEVRQQFSIRIFDGEIFLVVAHHRDQHLFRQIEKLGIEAAENNGWKFRQVDDGRVIPLTGGDYAVNRGGCCGEGRLNRGDGSGRIEGEMAIGLGRRRVSPEERGRPGL